MAIQGLRDTSNFVANQRPQNWRETIMLLYPNGAVASKAPLTALTSVMKSRSVDDPQYNWWEKSLNDRRNQIHATAAVGGADPAASAAGTTEVWNFKSDSDCLQYKRGDLLLVEQTKEILYVMEDPSSNTAVTVMRGFGGSTPAALDPNADGINPNVVCIGSAFEENSRAPTGINFDPEQKYNYTQIFRSTLEMSETAMRTRLRTGDQVKEARRECLEYFTVDMERAFWFGKRGSTTRNGRPLRTTDGIVNLIPTANQVAWTGGIVTMDLLMARLKDAFAYGSSEKMGFTGNAALLAINECIRKNTTWNIENNLKEFGMRVTRITTPFGELILKSHPLFNQMAGSTNEGGFTYYGWDSAMFILDMANIGYVYVNGRDVKYQAKLQDSGVDGMQSGYLAECGLELHHASTHFLWTGLVTGTQD